MNQICLYFGSKRQNQNPPPKGFQPQLYVDNSHLAPTDLYFYDFNSVWDVNDDGEYSIDREEANTRIDYYPEIYTGRILCTEPKHVENYTKKLIKYESNPGNGDFAYLRRSYFSAYHEMNYTAKKAKGTFEAYDFFDPAQARGERQGCLRFGD